MISRGSANIIANGLILLVGTFMLWSYGTRYITQRRLQAELDARTLHVGDRIPAAAGLKLSSPEDTLILAIKNGCTYCEQSMPFYRHLKDLQARGRLRTRITVVMPDEEKTAKTFLAANGLDFDVVTGVSLEQLKVPGTPMLILTSADARVQRVWIGKLEPEAEAQVTSAIEKGSETGD